jgi:hypothetical protein
MKSPTIEQETAMSEPSDIKSLFLNALEKGPPHERNVYLDEACAGDARLRQRVEALLRAHDDPDSALERPAADAHPSLFAATLSAAPVTEGAGSVIGHFKLLQPIGEGGFGVVYLAEQQEPVRRRVALKIIKPGMDSRQVIARFEAERQALAMMEHQNIARVLDAGSTGAGRPYFVMELVKGVPITEYCDKNKLAPRERLELFEGALSIQGARVPKIGGRVRRRRNETCVNQCPSYLEGVRLDDLPERDRQPARTLQSFQFLRPAARALLDIRGQLVNFGFAGLRVLVAGQHIRQTLADVDELTIALIDQGQRRLGRRGIVDGLQGVGEVVGRRDLLAQGLLRFGSGKITTGNRNQNG